MRGESTFPIATLPGVKRDGTEFESNYHNDAVWTRWQKGKARKMLGYRNITGNAIGVQRGCHMHSRNGSFYVHGGGSDYLQQFTFDSSGAMTGIAARTPTGFATSSNNMWTFDVLFDAGGSSTALLAHAAPNLTNMDSSTETPVYYGDVTAGIPLVAITGSSVSGGVVALDPYMFVYGNDGYLAWSDANRPYAMTGGAAGGARITGSKIVKGLPYRGGPSNSPSGLFWSLDSLLRVSYTGGTTLFRSDTLSAGTSILAQNSAIEFDGLYFWIENGRFMMFNGAIREVPNNLNIDWFFNNLNFAQRQKIWAYKVPRMGEIWWHFPKGTSTECNHAIVLNVREGIWYDTPIARSCGVYNQVFRYPIMFGTETGGAGYSKLWQHEYGYDIVDGGQTSAIQSYYETSDICFAATGPAGQWVGKDINVEMSRVEPDFVQVGSMVMTVKGRSFARSGIESGEAHEFTPTTTKIDLRDQYRQMRFRFESNTLGGYYEAGQTIIHPDQGDRRP